MILLGSKYEIILDRLHAHVLRKNTKDEYHVKSVRLSVIIIFDFSIHAVQYIVIFFHSYITKNDTFPTHNMHVFDLLKK